MNVVGSVQIFPRQLSRQHSGIDFFLFLLEKKLRKERADKQLNQYDKCRGKTKWIFRKIDTIYGKRQNP